MPNEKIFGILWRGINIFMNYKDYQQRKKTDAWLKSNGVNVAHIYTGTAELFQATKLATTTLRDCGRLLNEDQIEKLNSFLQATHSPKKRAKITQGQCYSVMNIAKQAQRKAAKFRKLRI